MAKGIKDWSGRKYPRSARGEFVATYPQLAVVLDGIFFVFLDIIREVVDRNVIVVNVLHDLHEGVSLNPSSGTQDVPFS